MKFDAAFNYLKRGHAIRVPEWGGYWRWNGAKKTVMMHTRSGDVIDIRQSDNMDYTLGFVIRDDWELVPDVKDTEHAEARGQWKVGDKFQVRKEHASNATLGVVFTAVGLFTDENGNEVIIGESGDWATAQYLDNVVKR